MIPSLQTAERRARYLMSVVSLLLVVALVLWKTGLVSTAPSYKEQAWYASSHRAGLVITTEYADEAECRSSAASASASTLCRQGKALAANAADYFVK